MAFENWIKREIAKNRCLKSLANLKFAWEAVRTREKEDAESIVEIERLLKLCLHDDEKKALRVAIRRLKGE